MLTQSCWNTLMCINFTSPWLWWRQYEVHRLSPPCTVEPLHGKDTRMVMQSKGCSLHILHLIFTRSTYKYQKLQLMILLNTSVVCVVIKNYIVKVLCKIHCVIPNLWYGVRGYVLRMLLLLYQEMWVTDRQGCTQKKFVSVRTPHICSYVLKDFDLLHSSTGKILQTKDDLSYYFNSSEEI